MPEEAVRRLGVGWPVGCQSCVDLVGEYEGVRRSYPPSFPPLFLPSLITYSSTPQFINSSFQKLAANPR